MFHDTYLGNRVSRLYKRYGAAFLPCLCTHFGRVGKLLISPKLVLPPDLVFKLNSDKVRENGACGTKMISFRRPCP